uniref:Berberine bridge enzyme n=1 Tax=Berberis stolonifera TaxID=33814 RepID=Q9ZPP5_BERST|nr:berberine bridge enzyme [Berberis stolonifera]
MQTALFFLVTICTITCTLGDVNLSSCLTSNGVSNFTALSTSSDSDYHRLLYVSMQNQIFTRPKYPRPSMIILPQSKEELAASVVCSNRGLWTIRLRSGGHSYEGLSYVADTPFVVIDLMNLNRISIDLESKTAWVESGATLGEIYCAISEASDTLGFSGGYCPTVGSGGHISGGGFGMMSRKYGLAADNVIDALIVDANGAVLDRSSMGEDVFWAIRGGGGGVWGAIYAWKLQLLPVPKQVTVFKLMKNFDNIEEASKMLHKWQVVAPALEDDFTLSVLAGADTNGIWFSFLGLYLGPKELAISSVDQNFPELNLVMEDCKEMSWVESFAHLAGLNSVEEMNNRFLKYDDRAFKTKVDFVKEPIPLEGIKGALTMLTKELRGFMAFNGQGGLMSRISSDSTPFPHRKGTLMMMEYIVAWDRDEDAKSYEFIGWLHGFYNYMGQFLPSDPRIAYVNHVDLDLGRLDWTNSTIASNAIEIARTWGEKYFLSNYERLVRAKTLIDPKNVFHHPQSIPPMPQDDLRPNGIWRTEEMFFLE